MGPEVAAVLPLQPCVKSPMGRQHRTGFSALVTLLSLLIFIEMAFLWGEVLLPGLENTDTWGTCHFRVKDWSSFWKLLEGS